MTMDLALTTRRALRARRMASTVRAGLLGVGGPVDVTAVGLEPRRTDSSSSSGSSAMTPAA